MSWLWSRKRKTKTSSFKYFYCSLKTYLNIYNNYELQQWAVEEKESLIKAQKKLVPRRHHNIALFLGLPDKSDETKINLREEALEFMKNMNQKQLVDFVL